MTRYLIERTFNEGLQISADTVGVDECLKIVSKNLDDEVTWIHSYVSDDKSKSFCIYDAPSPEAIRRSSRKNNLPIDKITEVRVLDPYFHL
jgi:hypothetical protein